jgi:hypothetical protein
MNREFVIFTALSGAVPAPRGLSHFLYNILVSLSRVLEDDFPIILFQFQGQRKLPNLNSARDH